MIGAFDAFHRKDTGWGLASLSSNLIYRFMAKCLHRTNSNVSFTDASAETAAVTSFILRYPFVRETFR